MGPECGGSSATPVIAGVAIALVLLGRGAGGLPREAGVTS
ncbi:LAETG motif-containing sortase-dependent surface protein [Streptomyces fulvoviolaceus]